MYPQRQLNRLDAYKTALRRDIALHRTQCATAVNHALQPLRLLDRGFALWRKFSPLVLVAAVPLSFVMRRSVSSRKNTLGLLLRWGPLLFKTLGRIRSLFAKPGETPDRETAA